MKHRWVFLHGGPGLNSEPERRYWEPALAAAGVSVLFWDEPRTHADPSRAFEEILESATQALLNAVASNQGAAVGLIGHAFGANTALALADRFPALVSKLVLLAPTTQIYTTFLRVMRIGHEEATRAGDQAASRLIEECLIATQSFPDVAMLQGLSCALSQRGTWMRYWHSLEHLQKYDQLGQTKEWALSASNRMAGWMSSAKHLSNRSTLRLNVPVWLGFGAEDEIISRAEEVRYLSQRFPIVEQRTFEGAGHFVQLEASALVADWLCGIQTSDSDTLGAVALTASEGMRKAPPHENPER